MAYPFKFNFGLKFVRSAPMAFQVGVSQETLNQILYSDITYIYKSFRCDRRLDIIGKGLMSCCNVYLFERSFYRAQLTSESENYQCCV